MVLVFFFSALTVVCGAGLGAALGPGRLGLFSGQGTVPWEKGL